MSPADTARRRDHCGSSSSRTSRTSLRPAGRSAAGDDVHRALDHLTASAAMLVGVAHAMRLLVVDEDGRAAGLRLPVVAIATRGVNAFVANTHRRDLVDEHVRRTLNRGPDSGMRTRGAAVCVDG